MFDGDPVNVPKLIRGIIISKDQIIIITISLKLHSFMILLPFRLQDSSNFNIIVL